MDAASHARESGLRVTGKHNIWESSNNAQRLSHNALGATREQQAPTRPTGGKRRSATAARVPSCLPQPSLFFAGAQFASLFFIVASK